VDGHATFASVPHSRLLIVKHVGSGASSDGAQLCFQIRQALSATPEPVVVFHDAGEMSLAEPGYAKAFKELDRDLGGQMSLMVCVIPSPVPRMMAHTVAMVSSRTWKVFKTYPEAFAFLLSEGVSFDADRLARSGQVELIKVSARASL
jgi:hypothetical protein